MTAAVPSMHCTRFNLAHFGTLAVLAAFLAALIAAAAPAQSLDWTNLASIPDAEGFAGAIAGVADGKLLLAGGANFPDKRPWEGGQKRWYDTAFVLDHPTAMWRSAGKLPRPLAYSVCITTPRGIAVLGGSNDAGHLADCFWLRLESGKVEIESLPSLPQAVSNACGGLLKGRLYLAGGTDSPEAVAALDGFYSLDIEHPETGWKREPTWPGVPRMLATAAIDGDAFYLVGGVALSADEAHRPQRAYLRDAYKFTPEAGWARIADLPWTLAASPSTAPAWKSGRFLILGGDDGSQVSRAPERHLGFRREVLAFDPHENRWSQIGTMPTALVTTTAVDWHQRIVVPGGEVRPGVRSVKVLSSEPR